MVIDSDALSRETRSFSKNVLDLSRQEPAVANHSTADIQDVGDRLAFLTYKTGEVSRAQLCCFYGATRLLTSSGALRDHVFSFSPQLYTAYAQELEKSRSYLKDVRNFETNLQPQRKQRDSLEKEIDRIYSSSKTKNEDQSNAKVASLKKELDALTAPESSLTQAELSALRLRRQKLVEAYTAQFDALQELGEKLAIIAGHGKVLLEGWDVSASAGTTDYVDGGRTAGVRTSVESALSSWTPAKAHIPKPQIASEGIQRSVSFAPSFHESHKDELASLHSVEDPQASHDQALDSYYRQPQDSPGLPNAPATQAQSTSGASAPVPIPGVGYGAPSYIPPAATGPSTSPSLAQQINNAPVTTLPGVSASPSAPPPLPHRASPSSPAASTAAPAGLPTVAETGAPITGTGGPSSGVLRPPSNSGAASASSRSSIKTKEEEAREDTQRRFEEYSGHETQEPEQSGLFRNASTRTQLPAYQEVGQGGGNPFADTQQQPRQ